MSMQVRVVEMEEKLKVPNREKLPHFWPLMWYVIAAYSQVVTSKHKLATLEIKGLKKLYKRLSMVASAKRYCPQNVESDRILATIKKILSEHCNDILPKNILMPTIIHFTHEEPPAKILKIEIPKAKVMPSVMVILPSEAKKIKASVKVIPDRKKSRCHQFPEEIWAKVFSSLCTRDRSKVAMTCKAFHRYVTARSLWRHVDFSHLYSLTPLSLKWLLRRAPESVSLPLSSSYRQTAWLLSRSPMMRKLTLKGASWSAISAINTGQAPPLRSLDLSWSVVTDSAIEEMTSCPTGNLRLGMPPPQSRLMRLQELVIDGADITNDALSHLSKLPELRSLSLVACVKITTEGITSFLSDTAQAPLDGSLNLADCCGLLVTVLPLLGELVQRGTMEIKLTESRNLSLGEYEDHRRGMELHQTKKWDKVVSFRPETMKI